MKWIVLIGLLAVLTLSGFEIIGGEDTIPQSKVDIEP